MAALGLVGLAAASASCHPTTPIPTYWDPVFADRSSWPELPAVGNWKPKPAPQACKAIYVVSAQMNLYAYLPKQDRFELRGRLNCPNAGWATPFSMAVAQTGVAHVVYSDGRLYAVDVEDASCEATGFEPNQDPGFVRFGMGYAAHDDGESLYVAEIHHTSPSRGLAKVDTTTGELRFIGEFSQNPGYNLELTPSGDGPLYGFFVNQPGRGGTLVKIDTRTANIVDATPLDVGTDARNLAIAWWGGSFYIFTGHWGTGTEVNRYDPESRRTSVVATTPETIVGAGVSTCAPTS